MSAASHAGLSPEQVAAVIADLASAHGAAASLALRDALVAAVLAEVPQEEAAGGGYSSLGVFVLDRAARLLETLHRGEVGPGRGGVGGGVGVGGRE